MKCLKNSETGNIIRVDEKQAFQMVGNTWKYVSKNEWKLQSKKTTSEVTQENKVDTVVKDKKKKTATKVKK